MDGFTSIYRRDIKFEASLVTPIAFLADTRQYPNDFTLALLDNGMMSLTRKAGQFPIGSYDADIVFDPETYRILSYRLRWYFDGNIRPPFEVKAWAIEYGQGGFSIPEQIRENSDYD